MVERGQGPDFIEALARGLHVLRSFSVDRPIMSLAEVATRTDLARPTARRILLTLEELGYVRSGRSGYVLTPRVLELGMAYIGALDLWDMARPHLEGLVAATGESSSMAQLDGSDIVYVARVAVPKLISLRVDIGTRFPAMVTSQGRALLSAMDRAAVHQRLAEPSRSGIAAKPYTSNEIDELLDQTAERGWALADQDLAPGVRSIAVPVRDGRGVARAAMNITVHAAETPVEVLTSDYLPLLLAAAERISADWSAWQRRPIHQASRTSPPR
ncbi:IclR family transcriptional regulator C-terminal domain-containing protein [Rhodococcus pyridinivorans]|uniref:IclR family transcriptional regulator domain-containing protein n=1 Tax=Rhodococcus pyridinivorans TaxID=103816 RepID=UPI001D132BF5|nr:IclR family transcriptional regulator C-terminal domain-containing protein [Rhodococcus pyridinivorans]MCD5422146.1 helix-turn-helix domain-containing protein [Rhodococcus pyridinivorans]UTM36834.1 helix-turn-helix domain-containing protein [Rhodococcus pyridinivorans]